MSVEMYPQPAAETDVFTGMNPGTVISMLPHLELDKKQYDIVNSYFLFRETSSVAAIANMIGVPYDRFVSTLEGVAYVVKEKVASDKYASRKSRIVKPVAEYAAPTVPKVIRQLDGDSLHLLEIETLRDMNDVPQVASMNTPVDGNCQDLSDAELEAFAAKKLEVQKKIIKAYCVNCALMEACGEYAVEQGRDDMVYGGYTKRALNILIKRRGTA